MRNVCLLTFDFQLIGEKPTATTEPVQPGEIKGKFDFKNNHLINTRILQDENPSLQVQKEQSK